MSMQYKLMICLGLFVPSLAFAQEREGTIYLPPMENTEAEFEQLAIDLTPAQNLQKILAEGNAELAEAIENHKRQRTFATKDRVMELVAQLSAKTIDEIGNLRANEDRIRDGLRQMIRKVEKVQHNLGIRKEELNRLDQGTEHQAQALNLELRGLAETIREHPENEEELRRIFRRKLLEAQRLSRQHRAFAAHVKLHATFAEQVARASAFFQHLQSNLDMLLEGLGQQKDLLVMRVQLLRDGVEMEAWLRGEGNADNSVVVLAQRIRDLQNALQRFNVATDLIVELDDVSDLLGTMPTFDVLTAPDGDEGVTNARRIEDQYIDYFLGAKP